MDQPAQKSVAALMASRLALQVYCVDAAGLSFRVSARNTEHKWRRCFAIAIAPRKNVAAPPSLVLFWLRTLPDFLRTAPQEHWENLGKEDSTMKNSGRDAVLYWAA